jgi:hypothetical protein
MNPREIVDSIISLCLLPAGLAVTSFGLHGYYGAAFLIYGSALLAHFLAHPPYSPWSGPDSLSRAIRLAARRSFVLLVLTTLNFLGSCPTWFLGLMVAATLMQWSGYFLVRPSRLAVPMLPEINQWNTLSQSLVLGFFLCDFWLIALLPNNLRFSEAFHLAGYALLAALQIMQLAHDFYRMRRSLLFWIRALAFQAN